MNQELLIHIKFFLSSFQFYWIILRAKLNFNLLNIKSIAICWVIIIRDLIELYVRIIDDIAIFS